jgi:hypothetical protein
MKRSRVIEVSSVISSRPAFCSNPAFSNARRGWGRTPLSTTFTDWEFRRWIVVSNATRGHVPPGERLRT